METERVNLHSNVREGYQILLRAEAELYLPCERGRIASFYRALAEKCMEWMTEVQGERVRQRFLALESTVERARFHAELYRFSMRMVWESASHVAFVCESTLSQYGEEAFLRYRRLSQVWNTEEQTLLPLREILRMLGVKLHKGELSFRPDGAYPTRDGVVLYRNASPRKPFSEHVVPICAAQESAPV
ncbi:MAG: hypothetical protein IJW30_01510 [Clostridia bacterium]|nr:hypothetical protein [Clostridia bacterium]